MDSNIFLLILLVEFSNGNNDTQDVYGTKNKKSDFFSKLPEHLTLTRLKLYVQFMRKL